MQGSSVAFYHNCNFSWLASGIHRHAFIIHVEMRLISQKCMIWREKAEASNDVKLCWCRKWGVFRCKGEKLRQSYFAYAFDDSSQIQGAFYQIAENKEFWFYKMSGIEKTEEMKWVVSENVVTDQRAKIELPVVFNNLTEKLTNLDASRLVFYVH